MEGLGYSGAGSAMYNVAQGNSEASGSGLIPQNSTLANDAEAKKLKRRVPEGQRKRAEASCDACKKRKVRCLRPNGPDEPCTACEQGKKECASTLPRKRRIYGSEEKLSARFLALEALVRHVFSESDTESLNGLLAIAQANSIEMPDLDQAVTGDALPAVASQTFRPAPAATTWPSIGDLRIPEGSLIPAPRGSAHYVGPASSFYFANTVRRLVSKCNLDELPSLGGEGFKRYFRAAEFTSFMTSQALEARIQGHPATSAADDDGSGSKPPDFSPAQPPQSSPAGEAASGGTRATLDRWREALPPRDLADKLTQAFFDRIHPNFLVFHRQSFLSQYDAVWSIVGREKGPLDPEPGWICCLLMVLAFGAQVLDEEGLEGATALQQTMLTVVVRDGLHRLALTASLANVQALMLLSLYHHNCGERNAAWMLVGQAARGAVAIGVMRDGASGNFDLIEHNTRRTVWYVLQLFEQNLSFVLGRPSSTDLMDVSASLPDDAHNDGVDVPNEWLAQAVALSEIALRVKRLVASISTSYDRPDVVALTYGTAQDLLSQLDTWAANLPTHLSLQARIFNTPRHRRATLLLHVTACHVKSVLARPFLLARINHSLDSRTQVLPPLPYELGLMAEQSVAAARAGLLHLQTLGSFGLLEGSVWVDFFYVHHASMVMCLPFLERAVTGSVQDLEDKTLVSSMLATAQRTRLAPTYRILNNVSLQLAHIVGIGPEEPEDPLELARATLPDPGVAASYLTGAETSAAGQALPRPPPTFEHTFGPVPSAAASPTDMFADLYNFGLDPVVGFTPWDFFHVSSHSAPPSDHGQVVHDDAFATLMAMGLDGAPAGGSNIL